MYYGKLKNLNPSPHFSFTDRKNLHLMFYPLIWDWSPCYFVIMFTKQFFLSAIEIINFEKPDNKKIIKKQYVSIPQRD